MLGIDLATFWLVVRQPMRRSLKKLKINRIYKSQILQTIQFSIKLHGGYRTSVPHAGQYNEGGDSNRQFQDVLVKVVVCFNVEFK